MQNRGDSNAEGYRARIRVLTEELKRLHVDRYKSLSDDRMESERYRAKVRVARDELSLLQGSFNEGFEQGLREGMMTSLIIRQLNRRLGPLENMTIEQLWKLQPEQIEHLSEALLDFSCMGELVNWLVHHPA